jgi:hypothetical protein
MTHFAPFTDEQGDLLYIRAIAIESIYVERDGKGKVSGLTKIETRGGAYKVKQTVVEAVEMAESVLKGTSGQKELFG